MDACLCQLISESQNTRLSAACSRNFQVSLLETKKNYRSPPDYGYLLPIQYIDNAWYPWEALM